MKKARLFLLLTFLLKYDNFDLATSYQTQDGKEGL